MSCRRRRTLCHYAESQVKDVGQNEAQTPKEADASIENNLEVLATEFASLRNRVAYLEAHTISHDSSHGYGHTPRRTVISNDHNSSVRSVPVHSHDPLQIEPARDSMSTGLPVFSGPTSSEFSIDMATEILSPEITFISTRGIRQLPGLSNRPANGSAVDTSSTRNAVVLSRISDYLDESEAVRLIGTYTSVAGVLHAVIDHHELIFKLRQSFTTDISRVESKGERGDATLLMVVLSIALLAEGAGHSGKADAMLRSVRGVIESKILNPQVAVKDLNLLLHVVSSRGRDICLVLILPEHVSFLS